jgi:hypothetical protein
VVQERRDWKHVKVDVAGEDPIARTALRFTGFDAWGIGF